MTDPDDLATLYREIFEVDLRGQRVLEDLHRRFGTPKCLSVGGLDALMTTYKSSAQAAVIGFIFAQINKAAGVPDPETPDDGETR
jgi:hypothetical protein